jgi:hypothetical protein
MLTDNDLLLTDLQQVSLILLHCLLQRGMCCLKRPDSDWNCSGFGRIALVLPELT